MASLVDAILRLFDDKDKVSNAELLAGVYEHVSASEEEVITEVNRLIESGRLTACIGKDDVLYERLDADQSTALQTLTNEEQLVLQNVRNAGNLGIWNQDIKNNTNIPTASVNRILKNLEQKKLVKSVKSVQHNKRLMWMLSELEPSVETAGNFLFQGQEEFNSDLLQNLMSYTKSLLQRQPVAFKAIAHFLREKLDGSLRDEDVSNVLKMMETLNQVERVDSGLYRAVTWTVPEPPPLPCLLCPLAKECHEHALISPKTCEYLTDWLNPTHSPAP